MRGVILAGGTGSRLFPITLGVSKQLLPVYDKPLIYYPISTLMLAGIREILIITKPSDLVAFQNLLGNGNQFGVSIKYVTQSSPSGIADALLLAEDFVAGENCALILGDNIFYGAGLGTQLTTSTEIKGAQIFAYQVSNPGDYGVINLDSTGKPVSIEEKPKNPQSNLAIPGLYFYDSSAVARTKELTPSTRGELEITDLNRSYLEDGLLEVKMLPRGTAWLDTGQVEDLHNAGAFVRVLEERQGLKLGCLEEISWRKGWISDKQLEAQGLALSASPYGKYLLRILETNHAN